MTSVDRRIWHRTRIATYVTVPESNFAHGRTIAWARAMAADPHTWEVRRVGAPTTDRCATREEAETALARLTDRYGGTP